MFYSSPTMTYRTPSGLDIELPEIVDIGGIARRLGVAKDTVNKWRHRGILPQPDYTLSVGPVWNWETIEAWAKRTGRLSG